jgi:hypothetical protein
MFVANGFEKFDPVHTGHIVVRDDTVGRAVSDYLKPLVGAGCCLDGELVAFTFKKRGGEVCKVGFVIDVDNLNVFLKFNQYIFC